MMCVVAALMVVKANCCPVQVSIYCVLLDAVVVE